MSPRALAFAAILAAAPLGAAPAKPNAPGPGELRLGRFGRVILHPPIGSPSQVVLFASGGPELASAERALALAATARGALVVELDARTYLAATAAQKGACTYAAADWEALSQRVQKQLALPVYRPPILMGAGPGAALADAVLSEAPPNTFRGAILLAPRSALKTAKPLCAGRGGPRESIEIAPDADGGLGADRSRLPRFQSAWASLSSPLPATRPGGATGAGEVSDLPLIEVPAAGSEGGPLAVVLSGDGGWAGLDKELAGALAARGIPTVGWNTLSYFWTARRPEGMAEDLTRVLRHYRAAWRRDRILLIGYSYGADVLPFMASRLPQDLSSRIAGVAMLAPSPRTAFEFHVSNWLGAFGSGGKDDEKPVLPEVKSLAGKLPGVPLLCLYGEKEADSLCPQIRPPLGKTISFAGAHHFGGDYGAIADRLTAEIAPGPPAAVSRK